MNLYQDVILQHNKTPFHFKKMTDAQHVIEAYNPLCGDRFKLFVNIENGKIADVYFHGYGCAVSKASTSVLAKHLSEQPLEEALKMCNQFLELIQSDEKTTVENADFKAFEAARDFPGRDQCAVLSWEEFRAFLVKT